MARRQIRFNFFMFNVLEKGMMLERPVIVSNYENVPEEFQNNVKEI